MLGAASFGAAALANAGAARVTGRNGWGLLALFYVLLALEVVVDWRHSVVREAAGWVGLQRFYGERRPFQAAAIVAGAAALAFALALAVRRSGRAALALAPAVAMAGLFMVEAVSLHQTDAWLYRWAGPVLLIAWLWLAGGAAACAPALAALTRRRW